MILFHFRAVSQLSQVTVCAIDDDFYDVDKVLSHRIDQGELQVRAKWDNGDETSSNCLYLRI